MKDFIQQFKQEHPDAVMLFRDSYTGYCAYEQDADTLHDITGCQVRKTGDIKTAYFPAGDLDVYLPKLVRAGHRVAICDKMEEPKPKKKLVVHENAPRPARKPSPVQLELFTF